MKISVVIRTLNESRYLGELLEAIANQELGGHECEVVVVDSGSEDATIPIAQSFGCRIVHIAPVEFSFGRSLNTGCGAAQGQILVFVSAHCVPASRIWLTDLVRPLVDGVCSYVYGRQIGRDATKYSERRVFLKYYPDGSLLPQRGFFANNANAALLHDVWERLRFDEALTGLEDMDLARRLVRSGGRVGYVADACVYHIHDESWRHVRNRYEREAVALGSIIPEARMSFLDFLGCTFTAIARDTLAAGRERRVLRELRSIVLFRINQYLGSYRGSRMARSLSRMHTRAYFHPHHKFERVKHVNYEGYRSLADESAQQLRTGQELQDSARQAPVRVGAR